MNQKNFTATTLILLSLITGVLFGAEKPNILFIAIDDLRPELGCYGATQISSPNIDRFATTGLVFQRAYCQQAVCNPSRTSLMTGLRPDTIGVTGNHSHFRSNKPDVVTLPQHFKKHGYHAQAIGKIYHGVFPDGASNTKWDTMGDPDSWSVPATRFGPRYYYTETGIEAAKDVYQKIYKPQNPGPDDWTKKLVFGPATESPDVSDDTLYDGKVANAAVAALGELRQSGQPFFLAVGFIKPHSPYVAPKKYFDLYKGNNRVALASIPAYPVGAPNLAGHGSQELRRYNDQPEKGEFTESNQRRIRQAYYACVSYIDAQIGRVLDELDKQGLADNTIVCLFGDHGYHLGEQGLWGKTTNFELDTRVPLIVRVPGMKSAGQSTNSLVELVDLYPTLAHLAGVPMGEHLEGKSFAKICDDPNHSTKQIALSQYPRGGELMGYSMRTPSHRLTQWVHRKSGEIQATELYDYANGMIETNNVASQSGHQSLIAQLTNQLEAAFATSFISTPTQQPAIKKTRVACVGDSITFGSGIKNKTKNSYPALLQQALGPDYFVRNFGFSGATLLKKGHKPYWVKPPFQQSLDFNPDIVVINLGANDVVDQNWRHASDFEPDYLELIETYRALPSRPKVFICEILPIMPSHGKYRECTKNREPMKQIIREVAAKSKTPLIDLHTPFVDQPEMFPDGLHPNANGASVMAQHVFTALTGKMSPVIRIEQPKPFDEENGTSFEECVAGNFTSVKSNLGTWMATLGHCEIDRAHARTGSQCLHLHGGEKYQAILAPANDVKTDGQLSFWAERWTSRNPFAFRIEKFSNGKWTEIYNGDSKIRHGRAFLGQVVIPLADPKIEQLRFSCTSPSNSGILIDDMTIKPAQPQLVKNIQVVPLALPALVGTSASALAKLKIETEGLLDAVSVTEITTTLAGTTDRKDIESVDVYYGGTDSNFRATIPFGKSLSPANTLRFNGSQSLATDTNYFWIACRLKESADIDHQVGAAIKKLRLSNGKTVELDVAPTVQRMGVAVRKGGDDGVHTYRIPGLATTNKGTLIGVYDIRRRGGGDLPGDINVGMSRSTDGGRTWDPMQVIMDMGNDPDFRYDGIGDPTVMVDRKTGTVWAAATWSHGNRSWVGSQPGLEPVDTGQFILVKSDDDGVTWSKPINITKQVKNPKWSFLLQGPGKGITLADGTIVLPAQYQDPPNNSDKKANRLPHSTFIYSRDHGESWHVATGAWDDTTESQVVELSDGEIMINCRNNRAPKRAVMTTTDMGLTWQEHPTHIKELIEPGSCMASLINVGRELGWRGLAGFDNEFLLFSNPDSLRGRNHLTIKASKNAGLSWPTEHHLLLDEQGGRGYSCMSMIDSETVGILYEGSQADMTFQRVKIADILNPPADQKTKNPAHVSKTGSSRRPPTSLSIAKVFGDHMVLQASQPIRIWGESKPGSKVSVEFSGKTVSAFTEEKGRWRVEIAPQKPNSNGQELVVTSGDDRIRLRDVLVGEVWFCAGQSNMEWPLSKTTNGAAAIESSHDALLRLLIFPGKARGNSGAYGAKHFASLVPDQFSNGSWAVASPNSSSDFSGVGYYFARELRKQLDTPVGIINVAVGGTPIEAWIDAGQLNQDPSLSSMLSGNWLDNSVLDAWCKKRARSNLQRGIAGQFKMPGDEFGPNHSFKPGFMHAASVVPFQPMSIRGVLWYQGESNGDNPRRTSQYQQAFPLMVKSWRREFNNPNMPWVFVQLPAMGRENWPVFREQQRRSLAKLNNVGMAITMDVGHPTNVHPKTKLPVGQRLAAWALANVYDKPVIAMGPLFKGASQSGRNEMVVQFDHVGIGLVTSDEHAPRHFEIAGDDKIFFPASAQINSKSKIDLFSDCVLKPVHARYAWAAFPDPPVNLVNSSGIPASPFTTLDDYLAVETNVTRKIPQILDDSSIDDLVTVFEQRPIPPGTPLFESHGYKRQSLLSIPLSDLDSDPTVQPGGVASNSTLKSRPNILLIVGEDHGCELSCYGDPVISTPNIDSLAANGILFEHGYVTQSVCSPSRSTIFTGLYPHQNGQLGLATHQYGWFKKWPTSYSLLKTAGYRTGLIGKTHIIPESAVEDFVDFRYQPNANFSKKNVSEYARQAGKFFRNGDAPFFITVNYPDAHWPLQGRVDGLPKTQIEAEKVKVMPYIGGDNSRLKKVVQNYYDCMLRLDECVGQLLTELEASGKAANTLVIFIGDHGAQMARGKVTVYEGGVRVPFIVRWPGKIKPAQRSKKLVSTIDLLPTFLDVASISNTPENLPGTSLREIFNINAVVDWRKLIACERNCDAAIHNFPQRTIRDGRYKLIWSPVRDRPDPAAEYYIRHGAPHWAGSLTREELMTASATTQAGYERWVNPPEFQLFDLHKDPHEWNDLGNNPKYNEVKQSLVAALHDWQKTTGDPIADPAKLKLLMHENDSVVRSKRRSPKTGWKYLEYLNPDYEFSSSN